jgi:hypothetical protein
VPDHNVTYNITQPDLDSYRNFLQQMPSVKLVIDTTLLLPTNTSGAVSHVKAVGATLGGWEAIEAVEIGNECDIFYENGLRPRNYTYGDYAKEFRQYADDIVTLAGYPRGKFQGATFCCKTWDANTTDYIDTFASDLTTLSIHRYPLARCNGAQPRLDQLLEDSAAQAQAAYVARWTDVSVWGVVGLVLI